MSSARPCAPAPLRAGEGLSGRAMAEGRVIAAGDYLDRRVPARRSHRRPRPADRHRRPHRRADHRRRGPARRHRGLPPRDARLRRHRRGRPRRSGRPGGDRDHQRPAHRGARALAGGRRPPRRHGAGAARHHRPDRRAARAGGHPGPGRRGGPAAARHGRRAPHPDERRPHVPRPGRGRRRQRPGHPDLAAGEALPARRRDQRPGGVERRGGLDQSTTGPIRASPTTPTTRRSPGG